MRRRFAAFFICIAAQSLAATTQAADFLVVNLDDSGPGSLRQAIDDANGNPGPDVIRFAPRLNGTITLDPIAGELTITDDVSILGPSRGRVAVSGGGATRVINIPSSDLTVEITRLMITRGAHRIGSGVFNGTGNTTVIAHSVFDSNVADPALETDPPNQVAFGGAIFNQAGARLHVVGTKFKNNVASSGFLALGGAIGVRGEVTIDFSTFRDNSVISDDQAGGGAIEVRGVASIKRSAFVGNVAEGPSATGGAVRVLDDSFGEPLVAELTMSSTWLKNNVAQGVDAAGGAVGLGSIATLRRVSIWDNLAMGDDTAAGGGVSVFNSFSSGVVELYRSTIVHNQVRAGMGARGGGIAINEFASACRERTLIARNRANGTEDNIDGVLIDGCPAP